MKNKNNQSSSSTKWIIIVFILVIFCSIFITELMSRDTKKTNDLIAKEGERLILLTKNDCAKCEDMDKVLQQINTNDGIEVYSINIDELSKSDFNDLLKTSDLIDENVIPTVLHVSAGAVIGSYTASANYNSIIDFMYVYKPLTVSQYVELVKEDKEHYIYIGRPTCGYCVQSMPWSKRIARELSKDIYYINIDSESASDLELLAESTNDIYRGATPLFLVTKNNKIVRYVEGAKSYDDLNAFFNGTSN
jgi:predicted bacteriocin transport accessory protein